MSQKQKEPTPDEGAAVAPCLEKELLSFSARLFVRKLLSERESCASGRTGYRINGVLFLRTLFLVSTGSLFDFEYINDSTSWPHAQLVRLVFSPSAYDVVCPLYWLTESGKKGCRSDLLSSVSAGTIWENC